MINHLLGAVPPILHRQNFAGCSIAAVSPSKRTLAVVTETNEITLFANDTHIRNGEKLKGMQREETLLSLARLRLNNCLYAPLTRIGWFNDSLLFAASSTRIAAVVNSMCQEIFPSTHRAEVSQILDFSVCRAVGSRPLASLHLLAVMSCQDPGATIQVDVECLDISEVEEDEELDDEDSILPQQNLCRSVAHHCLTLTHQHQRSVRSQLQRQYGLSLSTVKTAHSERFSTLLVAFLTDSVTIISIDVEINNAVFNMTVSRKTTVNIEPLFHLIGVLPLDSFYGAHLAVGVVEAKVDRPMEEEHSRGAQSVLDQLKNITSSKRLTQGLGSDWLGKGRGTKDDPSQEVFYTTPWNDVVGGESSAIPTAHGSLIASIAIPVKIQMLVVGVENDGHVHIKNLSLPREISDLAWPTSKSLLQSGSKRKQNDPFVPFPFLQIVGDSCFLSLPTGTATLKHQGLSSKLLAASTVFRFKIENTSPSWCVEILSTAAFLPGETVWNLVQCTVEQNTTTVARVLLSDVQLEHGNRTSEDIPNSQLLDEHGRFRDSAPPSSSSICFEQPPKASVQSARICDITFEERASIKHQVLQDDSHEGRLITQLTLAVNALLTTRFEELNNKIDAGFKALENRIVSLEQIVRKE